MILFQEAVHQGQTKKRHLYVMKNYLNAIKEVLINGQERRDRTGVGTIGLFGMQQRYDLNKGFPAVTTKKLAWKSVVSELLWFLEGSGDERRLAEILHKTRDENKKTIWSPNAEADYWLPNAEYKGDLGRVYGVQSVSYTHLTLPTIYSV